MYPTYNCELPITYNTSKCMYTYNMFSITLDTTFYHIPVYIIYDIIYIFYIVIIYIFIYIYIYYL